MCISQGRDWQPKPKALGHGALVPSPPGTGPAPHTNCGGHLTEWVAAQAQWGGGTSANSRAWCTVCGVPEVRLHPQITQVIILMPSLATRKKASKRAPPYGAPLSVASEEAGGRRAPRSR
jgi:hypothetical protein